MKIGIIGYRNHASRLLNLISNNKDCQLKYVYHPSKQIDHPCATNNLHDLYKCDAVIIASPNDTHFDYIMNLLKNFNGYVFCEKPPVTKLQDLNKLSQLSSPDKERLYFNFNFRFGLLNKTLNDSYYLEKLGKINFIQIITTHGLAFKPDYKESWRAKNLNSIIDTVAIHYIDLLILNFGSIKNYFYNPQNIANKGIAYDTVNLALNFENVSSSIFTSYAGPYFYEILIYGTDGVIKINDKLQLFHPRDTFDQKGFFKLPPVKEVKIKEDYETSLKDSFDFFVSHVKEKKKIDTNYFEASISSNRFLLNLLK